MWITQRSRWTKWSLADIKKKIRKDDEKWQTRKNENLLPQSVCFLKLDTLYTYACPSVQVFAVADLYWYYSHILLQSVILLLLNQCRHSCNEVHNISTAVQFSQKVPVPHPEFISHLAALSDFLISDTDKYRESFLWEAVFLILSQCESHVKHLPVGWTFFSFFFFSLFYFSALA